MPDPDPAAGVTASRAGTPIAPILVMNRSRTSLIGEPPRTSETPRPPGHPQPAPDTVPTTVPPERPFSPEAPDVMPGAPHESPVPGLPPEVGPAIAPVEVPPLGPGG